MKTTRWAGLCVTGLFFLSSSVALAQGRGRGHDKDDDHGHDRDDDRNSHFDDHIGHYYNDHDRDDMRAYYHVHYKHLPPGLAKKDRLPPGLEKQLVVRGTLPPGLRSEIHPCPVEIVRELPPPPPDYEHVVIGGHIVLLNRKNFFIADVFHFEIN